MIPHMKRHLEQEFSCIGFRIPEGRLTAFRGSCRVRKNSFSWRVRPDLRTDSIWGVSRVKSYEGRAVVSHISRKTSEMWGTQDLWSGRRLVWMVLTQTLKPVPTPPVPSE